MSYINGSDFIDLYIKFCQRGFGYIASKINVNEKKQDDCDFQ
jgi:hypothetical protein